MAASDYVPIFFKNRLHLAGRPQMSTRPECFGASSDTTPFQSPRALGLQTVLCLGSRECALPTSAIALAQR
jgi:hypothetical protein